jgi:hypothetical protein
VVPAGYSDNLEVDPLVSCRNCIKTSLAMCSLFPYLRRSEFFRLILIPIRVAIAPDSSVRPARIRRFFRLKSALMVGVMKQGSDDETVMVRSG